VPVGGRAVPGAVGHAVGPESRGGRDGNAIVARRQIGGLQRFTAGQSDRYRQTTVISPRFIAPFFRLRHVRSFVCGARRRIKLMIAVVAVVVVGGLVFQQQTCRT